MLFKSKENIKAAHLLIEEELFCSSVHCLYYGCFQLMKHMMNDILGVDYETQNKNYLTHIRRQKIADEKRLGSHEFLIHEFIKSSMSKDSRKTITINRNVFKLKENRSIADYHTTRIDRTLSSELSEIANETCELINEIYGYESE